MVYPKCTDRLDKRNIVLLKFNPAKIRTKKAGSMGDLYFISKL